MTARQPATPPFDYTSGHPCLDFVNTQTWWGAPERGTDRLATFGDLAAWARGAGLVSATEERELVRRAEREPMRAAAVLGQARELRAIVREIFSGIAHGDAPSPERLAAFNDALRGACGTVELAWAGDEGRFAWNAAAELTLDTILARVAWLAAQLMTTGDLTRLRECADAECAWVFLDTTKNRSRRWCSMGDCGSRAKARRYYARRTAERRQEKGERR